MKKLDPKRMPAHIAIIMDGNGRWARRRGLPRLFGHREGSKRVPEIVQACTDLGVKVLTLYAFSTENWARPATEVSGLMGILRAYLRSQYDMMMQNNIRLRTVGDISKLPESAREEFRRVMKDTAGNTGLVLNLALNYGGRSEIVRAVNRLIKDGAEKVTEGSLTDALDTTGLPDPDLLIRTSGEMRISNFLLWQTAYAEFYVTPLFWPEFTPERLHDAIEDYQRRERRFGGITAR